MNTKIPEPKTRAFVESNSTKDPTTGCWIWNLCIGTHGYGVVNNLGKNTTAHRISFALFKSDIPSGLLVLHNMEVQCES